MTGRALHRNERIDEGRYAPVAAAIPSNAQVIFYANENFQGQSFTAQSQVDDFTRYGFNDRASSVVVLGDQWEVCENVRFSGSCVVLRPGRYALLVSMGIEDRVSSIRGVAANARVGHDRYAPLSAPVYDNRLRSEERLYDVDVTSVRAAAGANIGRITGGGQQAAGQDVQKCETVPSQARTEFWDVTYTFRGQEHTVQTTSQPGRTITVNGQGEPRV